MEPLAEDLFRASPAIRYVALYRDGRLQLFERPNLRGASSSESDRYEELIVNPAVLVLTGQRGRIDCGGLEYVLIRYGSFFQMLHAVPGGHLSVAFEPEADPLAHLGDVRRIARERRWNDGLASMGEDLRSARSIERRRSLPRRDVGRVRMSPP